MDSGSNSSKSANASFRDDIRLNLTFMELTSLTHDERVLFSVFVAILLAFSLISNIATIIVGVKSRKIRPFFRTCLICLATSDLLSSVFNGITYLSQYTANYVQIWTLGGLMCTLCPFITTVAILANSLILVSIAVDRYLSVIKLMRNFWERRVIYCLIFAIIIWGLSIGIATPSLTAFKYLAITILETDPNNSSIVLSSTPAYLCAASKKDSARYYMILLFILFVPIAIAFIWFNSILAYEIWNRRKAMNGTAWHRRTSATELNSYQLSANSNQSPTKISIISMDPITKKSSTNATNSDNPSQAMKPARSNRDSRQLRMFFVIIMLMVMFIAFRMPVWIYLILRFYNNFISVFHMVLQYCFGMLSLFGCALNPFLYAFLTQTIHYAVTIYKKAQGCCGLRRLFVRPANARNDVVLPSSGNVQQDGNLSNSCK